MEQYFNTGLFLIFIKLIDERLYNFEII